MNKTVIEVQVRAVLPTSGGWAVFLGNNDKVFIIYVDQTVGSAITMFMRQITKERPLTHDLMAHLLTALGAKVERVIINDLKNATYYARVIIRVQNELHQKKIIELEATLRVRCQTSDAGGTFTSRKIAVSELLTIGFEMKPSSPTATSTTPAMTRTHAKASTSTTPYIVSRGPCGPFRDA